MFSLIKKLLGTKEGTIIENEFSPNEHYYKKVLCPYCNNKLHKLPSNKIKCQNCNRDVYTRSNPINKHKLLLTEEQLNKVRLVKSEISKQNWINGTWSRHSITDNEFIRFKDSISKKTSSKIDDYEVIFSMLNDKAIGYGQNNCWGLYSTANMDMADALHKHGNFKNALEYYLHVSYIDLNGPLNFEDFNEKDLKKHPPFNKRHSFVAPYVVDQITDIMEKLNIDIDNLEKIFIRFNLKFKIPYVNLVPDKAWDSLKDYL